MAVENYPRGVEVVAATLIVNKNKQILLIKSHRWGDIYLLPGGHVEPGESIIDAAKREGEEETGLKLKPLYCVNIGELINDSAFHRKAHLVYFHYVCEALSDEVTLEERELKEFVWMEPEDALKNDLITERVKETIENYMKGIKSDISSDVFDEYIK